MRVPLALALCQWGVLMQAKILAVAGVALIGAVSQAFAAIVDVTYTGTVTQGWDQTGIFGIVDNSGNAYVGDSYVANYMFDTTLGTTLSSPGENYAYGGTQIPFPAPNPGLSGSITINGVTVPINPPYGSSEILGLNNGSNSQQLDYLENDGSGPYGAELSGEFLALDTSISASITTPLSYVAADDPNQSGAVVVTLSACSDPTCDTYTIFTQVYGNVQTFTVTASPTPLPSTWLMLLTGFVGLGFFAYRGTKASSAALAAA